MFTDFDKRMKRYEKPFQISLPIKMPVIIRVDGRSFHTFCHGLHAFDVNIRNNMMSAAEALVDEIQGIKLAYSQSDEISLLLVDYDTPQTQAWFDYNIQKLTSISASIASVAFYKSYKEDEPYSDKVVSFDSRCFVLPQDEVENYYLWRETDAIRNSIMSLAREYFSHKQLNGLKVYDMKQKLLEEKDVLGKIRHMEEARVVLYKRKRF